jgi:hypothetical protein
MLLLSFYTRFRISAASQKYMNRLLLFFALFLGQISSAQKMRDSSFGRPVLIYTVYDPWAVFMGADGPILSVYESGKVIFWKNREYRIAQLTKEEKDELLNELNLSDTFFLKSKDIQATFSTDQPTYVLETNFDTLKYFSVYGRMNEKESRKNIPKQLSKIYEAILAFDNDDAITWIPEKIEVMLSDYAHSPETPLKWPGNWPDLNSPETVIRQTGVTSIYLDKKYFGDLKKLLRKRKEKQAIEINGRKFYAEYRFPLPNLN